MGSGTEGQQTGACLGLYNSVLEALIDRNSLVGGDGPACGGPNGHSCTLQVLSEILGHIVPCGASPAMSPQGSQVLHASMMWVTYQQHRTEAAQQFCDLATSTLNWLPHPHQTGNRWFLSLEAFCIAFSPSQPFPSFSSVCSAAGLGLPSC